MTRAVAVGLAGLLLAPSLFVDGSAQQSVTRTVLFALQRNQRLHAFDAQTLQHLGYFVTGPLGDGLGVRADGRRLFLLQSMTMRGDPNVCCSLHTIDLATREMCWMSDFASGPVTTKTGLVGSADGLFNAETLERVALPRGFRAAFGSRFSPDARYVAGIDRGPALVFSDTTTGTRKSMPVPDDARAGDWLGNRYAVISAGSAKGQVWLVAPDDAVLPAPRAITWPDRDPRITRTFTLGTDLISHERFGRSIKMDRREKEPAAPGGALVIPSAGGAARRVARDIYFTALVPGLDGHSLYGVEAGPLEGGPVPVRLIRLDARTGAVIATLVLNDPKLFPGASFTVWSLAIANVPVDLIPKGETQVAACTRR